MTLFMVSDRLSSLLRHASIMINNDKYPSENLINKYFLKNSESRTSIRDRLIFHQLSPRIPRLFPSQYISFSTFKPKKILLQNSHYFNVVEIID